MGKTYITLQLLNNVAATGEWFHWPGGEGVFTAEATWGGGTVKLQRRGDDGTTAVDVGTDTTLTANGGGVFSLGECYLRAHVATATAVYAGVRNL